ncbi:hypothetical protein EDC04DRAFT_1406746 [Pisolithus marmoratus]|nr:hypothetical protein EDC04DRAFT_1406746 [Pisolithus marmoratus]
MTNGNKNDKGPSETQPLDEKRCTAKAKTGSPTISAVQTSLSEELTQRELPSAPAHHPLQNDIASSPAPSLLHHRLRKPSWWTPITRPDQTPIRAPPRIVDTIGRSCLVDQRDRTPKQYPNSCRNDGNEQSGDSETWPPVRLAKGKKPAHTGRASHMVAQHHPFSQVQKIGQPVASAPVWLNDTLLVATLRIKTMLMEGTK